MSTEKSDNLFFDARPRIISGIKKCANAVGMTMGTSGANSLIETVEHPGTMTTNDGATILEKIKLADPIEEMGRKVLYEAVSRANKSSGDGSSTTCVLTAAILEEGQKYLDSHAPMDIKRSLEECIPLIEKSIEEQKRTITVDDVGKVAAISAEDEGIGAMIQEIYQQIGKEGIIHWDISKTDKDSYTIGQGITVHGASLASPYMADRDQTTGQFTQSARLKKPKILIVKDKLATAAVFEKVFLSLFNKGQKEVVIFCEDFDITVVAQLVMTQQTQGFRAVLVKMPVLWRDEWYIDLALASGATVIDSAAGIPLKDISVEHFGEIEHITIDKENSYIDGIKDLSSHIAELDAEGTDQTKLRASRLNTKTARYFVGAPSDAALSYRRLKVEDAIAAAWHALDGGIVAGGGVTLKNSSLTMTDSVGGLILKKALCAPMSSIMTNAGLDSEGYFVFKDPHNFTDGNEPLMGNRGFDTRTKELVDMFDAGIIDPANIVTNACKNAISVAASVLTAGTIVTFPPVDKEKLYG